LDRFHRPGTNRGATPRDFTLSRAIATYPATPNWSEPARPGLANSALPRASQAMTTS